MSDNDEYKPDTNKRVSDNDYETRRNQKDEAVPVVDDAQAGQDLAASDTNDNSEEQQGIDRNKN